MTRTEARSRAFQWRVLWIAAGVAALSGAAIFLSQSKPSEITFSSVIGPNVLWLNDGKKAFRVRLIGIGDGAAQFPKAADRKLFEKQVYLTVRELVEDRTLVIERDAKYPIEKDGTIPVYLARKKEDTLNYMLAVGGGSPVDAKTWEKAERLDQLKQAETAAKTDKRGIWDSQFLEFARKSEWPSYSTSVQYVQVPLSEMKPGVQVRLHEDRQTVVFAAINPLAYQDLRKFIRAKDENGISDLVASGEVLLLQDHTNAKVIERDLNGFHPCEVEVQILDGDHACELLYVGVGSLKYRRTITYEHK